MCSPARRSGSKIPIGEFWAEKRDKAKKSKVPALVLDQSGKFEDTADKENLGYEGAGGGNVKRKHIKNYEILTQDVISPVINKAEYESQFSGLLQSINSPDYRKAELDFEKIAQENISDNLLDDNTEAECIMRLFGMERLRVVNKYVLTLISRLLTLKLQALFDVFGGLIDTRLIPSVLCGPSNSEKSLDSL